MKRQQRTKIPVLLSEPNSQVAESYRKLRANIEFASVLGDTKVILVSSAVAQEGKSFTASNLALVFAESGHKVLLIDADMRRPLQHYMFSLSNLVGLSTVLVNHGLLDEAIQQSTTPNLHVLPSGPTPHNPAEMLSSDRFRDLVAEMRLGYETVVIDSPPVLALSDSLVLGNVVDGTVLVINAQTSNRHFVRKAILELTHANARLLGVVLNDVRPQKDKFGYYLRDEPMGTNTSG
jgi:capsular exopolysaccharide synthesis family protein